MGFLNKLFGIKSGMCGGNLRWELFLGTLTISGTGKMDDYDSDTPTPWNSSRELIRHVMIADKVTTVGDRAFTGCESLTSVTIPDSVTTIGISAFSDCTSLKEIHYPASAEFDWELSQGNNAKLIPYNVATPVKSTTQPAKSGTQPTTQPAKSGTCGKNLRWKLDGSGTLTISGTGKMDDYYVDAKIAWLSSKESIKRVVIADGVTSIGDSAFSWCTSLTSVTIPDSVTSIGNLAFSWCGRLTSVTIPDSVTSIGNGAFFYCERLTSVTIPDSVTSIGGFAFSGCGLTSVTIPDSVTSIGEQAFDHCDSLMSLTIPDSVTSIGNSAFNGCHSLTSVTIGNSVTSIGRRAFGGCTSLKEIHYPARRGFKKNLSIDNNAKLIPYNVATPVTKPTTQTVTQPKPTTQPVAEKLTWSFAGKTLTVGGVREIKFFPYAQIPWLKHLHDIQRIVIGEGVEKIAAQAFEECKRLEIVTLPASVKTIGDMFASVSFCGDRFVNGGRNVFWCIEDGVLVLKKNPVAVGDDFSTGFASWIFADKNIRGVKLERGIKPTEKFFEWLSSHDGAAISFE